MSDLFRRTPLDEAVAALRSDLVDDDGPRISTMRNYRFALLVYRPQEELALRDHTRRLVAELEGVGWSVLTLSLHTLLFDRLRRLGSPVIHQLIAMERQITLANGASAPDPDRGLNFLRDQLAPLIEGPAGIAADVAEQIRAFTIAHPDKAERTLVLVGAAGALYPFFRTSALLKHLDGRTGQVPVVLLYPGERHGDSGLSFMGRTAADRDYRPRIYG
jgi:hypothetical protein